MILKIYKLEKKELIAQNQEAQVLRNESKLFDLIKFLNLSIIASKSARSREVNP